LTNPVFLDGIQVEIRPTARGASIWNGATGGEHYYGGKNYSHPHPSFLLSGYLYVQRSHLAERIIEWFHMSFKIF
jgi:hypothetical protein